MSTPQANFVTDPSDPCSPLSIPAERTALLLMDILNLSLAIVPDSESLLDTVCALQTWGSKQGMMVIHCVFDMDKSPPANTKKLSRLNAIVDTYRKEPLALDEPERLSAKWTDADIVSRRTPGIVSCLSPNGSDLHAQLQSHQIESLILCGVSTSGCVLSTAKNATDSGFITTVIEDGCRDRSAETHEMVINEFLVGSCHVTAAEAFKGAWEKVHGAKA